jgi:hypothetical protein
MMFRVKCIGDGYSISHSTPRIFSLVIASRSTYPSTTIAGHGPRSVGKRDADCTILRVVIGNDPGHFNLTYLHEYPESQNTVTYIPFRYTAVSGVAQSQILSGALVLLYFDPCSWLCPPPCPSSINMSSTIFSTVQPTSSAHDAHTTLSSTVSTLIQPPSPHHTPTPCPHHVHPPTIRTSLLLPPSKNLSRFSSRSQSHPSQQSANSSDPSTPMTTPDDSASRPSTPDNRSLTITPIL